MLDGYPQIPDCVDVEQALLGAILLDNSTLDRIPPIEPADFSDDAHARLFGIMRTMYGEGQIASPLTLRRYVSDWEPINPKLTFADYVARLVEAVPSLRDAPAYALTVREMAIRRKLFGLGTDLVRWAGLPEATVAGMADEAVAALDEILSVARIDPGVSVSIGQGLVDVLSDLSSEHCDDSIPTGLKSMDAALVGGWQRQQYIILAGRPSMGKTTAALSMMLRTAKAGHGVLFLSLEMPAKHVVARALADIAYAGDRRIAYNEIIGRKVDARHVSYLHDASQAYRQLPLLIEDRQGLSVAEIGARVRAVKDQMARDGAKLGLVVIDHLGFVKPPDRYRGSRVNEVTEISAAIKQIAKEQDLAVMLLCQLNRGTEGRENKRPTLSDLRDSGSLEQDADVVLFTYREAYYLERLKHEPGSQAECDREAKLQAFQNMLELVIAKNRNGEPRTVTVWCDMGANAIRDLAR
jgi:replicative DNA helicase